MAEQFEHKETHETEQSYRLETQNELDAFCDRRPLEDKIKDGLPVYIDMHMFNPDIAEKVISQVIDETKFGQEGHIALRWNEAYGDDGVYYWVQPNKSAMQNPEKFAAAIKHVQQTVADGVRAVEQSSISGQIVEDLSKMVEQYDPAKKEEMFGDRITKKEVFEEMMYTVICNFNDHHDASDLYGHDTRIEPLNAESYDQIYGGRNGAEPITTIGYAAIQYPEISEDEEGTNYPTTRSMVEFTKEQIEKIKSLQDIVTEKNREFDKEDLDVLDGVWDMDFWEDSDYNPEEPDANDHMYQTIDVIFRKEDGSADLDRLEAFLNAPDDTVIGQEYSTFSNEMINFTKADVTGIVFGNKSYQNQYYNVDAIGISDVDFERGHFAGHTFDDLSKVLHQSAEKYNDSHDSEQFYRLHNMGNMVYAMAHPQKDLEAVGSDTNRIENSRNDDDAR